MCCSLTVSSPGCAWTKPVIRSPSAESWNVRYLADVMRRIGLDRDFAVVCEGGIARSA